MTNKQKENYEDTNTLREILRQLNGRKFKLDCGHYALSATTWGMTSPFITTTQSLKLSVHSVDIRKVVVLCRSNNLKNP
jgi:hypothetical protein